MIYLTLSHEVSLRRKWRSVQAATKMFWRRWVREYLPILTIRRKWNSKSRNFKVGDLVKVMMKDMPRSYWPMRRVLETWRFEWCSSYCEVEHSIGRNYQTSLKNRFAWRQSGLIIRSHRLTGEGGCYAICNCNVANIDVVALYLSERLNNNLYFTLEKLIFSVRIYIFLSAFFLSVRRKIRQMQPRERRRQILW